MKNIFLLLVSILTMTNFTWSCKKTETVNPQVSITRSVKTEEGNSMQTSSTLYVTLSAATDKQVSLTWSTMEGTAKAGTDYIAVHGAALTFEPGETSKSIEVTLVNDLVLEFDDSFTIQLSDVQNALAGNDVATVTIVNDDSYVPEIASDGPFTPDAYDGMKLAWSDEFNGTAVNTDFWKFEKGGGGWGNNELQIYTDSPVNAYTEDGKLNIVATKSASGVYNSARMITSGKKEFTYGRIDIRAKLPKGQGIWPALWMLGSNIGQVSWPACGEIDIMEYLGHDVLKVYGTAHYNDNGHQSKGSSYTLTGGQCFNDKFHVYTILWQENSIVWYVDYQEYFKVTSSSIKFGAFNLPQFFIFNVAVGGQWPGNPDATTVFPQTMQVDYIRVFQPL